MNVLSAVGKKKQTHPNTNPMAPKPQHPQQFKPHDENQREGFTRLPSEEKLSQNKNVDTKLRVRLSLSSSPFGMRKLHTMVVICEKTPNYPPKTRRQRDTGAAAAHLLTWAGPAPGIPAPAHPKVPPQAGLAAITGTGAGSALGAPLSRGDLGRAAGLVPALCSCTSK